jgi:hypothetical protein
MDGIVAFGFTKNPHDEVARARLREELDIKLVTISEILDMS